jgi:2Fe-2S ferredoxin
MTKITYIESNGTEHIVEVEPGLTVTEGAVRNNIPGIDAECGGASVCATCHVYVDRAWFEKAGERNAMEEAMLDLLGNVKANSRLACRIRVTAELDGLVVRMPQTQH